MEPITQNGYIINPTEEVTPAIRISPFRDQDICYWKKGNVAIGRDLIHRRFTDPTIHLKARYAIISILHSLKLKADDCVTILTTSGNSYISSCVTNAISMVCKWNRIINERTSVILVNHEFGYEFKDLDVLRHLGVPIIEDCAHIFSHSENIGNVGDYIIYSLPKVFPMQIGCIVNKNNPAKVISEDIDSNSKEYIMKALSLYLPDLDLQTERTIRNYEVIKQKIEPLGLSPYFDNSFIGVPNVFMFKSEKKMDLIELKAFMQKNGVESSVFYGEEAFFIPSNWGINDCEIDYMVNLLKYFINNSTSIDGF